MYGLQPIDKAVSWRDAIRDQIKILNGDLELNLIQAIQTSNRGPNDAEYLQAQLKIRNLVIDMKAHFHEFLKRDGTILAAPLYQSDQFLRTENLLQTVRIRKSSIGQLLQFNSSTSQSPKFAIKSRLGVFHNLWPLFDSAIPSEMLNTAHDAVWEWIFLVLEEDEDVNELWWRAGRWIWMGRFELGLELGRGKPFPNRPHTENPNVAGEIFNVDVGGRGLS